MSVSTFLRFTSNRRVTGLTAVLGIIAFFTGTIAISDAMVRDIGLGVGALATGLFLGAGGSTSGPGDLNSVKGRQFAYASHLTELLPALRDVISADTKAVIERSVLHRARETLKVTLAKEPVGAAVWVREGTTGEMVVLVSSGLDGPARGRRLPVGGELESLLSGPERHVALATLKANLDSEPHDAMTDLRLLHGAGAQSLCGSPIWDGRTRSAVLTLQCTRSESLREPEQEYCKQLAAIISAMWSLSAP